MRKHIIAVAGTRYVGIIPRGTHNKVYAMDIVPEKVDNFRQSSIQGVM